MLETPAMKMEALSALVPAVPYNGLITTKLVLVQVLYRLFGDNQTEDQVTDFLAALTGSQIRQREVTDCNIHSGNNVYTEYEVTSPRSEKKYKFDFGAKNNFRREIDGIYYGDWE